MSVVTVVRKRIKERLKAGEVILCALCGDPIPANVKRSQAISHGGKGGLSMDHIIEKSKGGKDVSSNLQPTHNLCNNQKSNYKGRADQRKIIGEG